MVTLLLMTLHYVGDFLLQSDWMATNKSSSFKALSAHVAVYSLMFLPFGWEFWSVTFVLHWITDAVTSRITARLWLADERHWFFCMIGADQLLHLYMLVGTWFWIYGGR